MKIPIDIKWLFVLAVVTVIMGFALEDNSVIAIGGIVVAVIRVGLWVIEDLKEGSS